MDDERRHRLLLRCALTITSLAVCTLAACLAWLAWSGSTKQYDYLVRLPDGSPRVTLDECAESRVTAFCGDCHALPRPESFPRDAWHREVRQGYEKYILSKRNDLDPPPMQLTIAYYRSRAPEKLVFPEPDEAETELQATFVTQYFASGLKTDVPPAVSHLRYARLDPDETPVLLACDMRSGGIAAIDVRNGQAPPQLLARLNNPCRIEPCDLDGDQSVDLVVADLGSYFPFDHDRGRVVWLRRREKEGAFEQVVLAAGLGRVADVRPADFDSDGDLDLIVAEFGYYKTGGVALLRNVAAGGERPRFEPEVLDSSPGTIHTPVHDFDKNGRPDFLALVSQEQESLNVFLNQPNGSFRHQTLWTAPDLTFGSSGIQLIDLDQDGDVDVLQTNGDSFDTPFVSPSHGVQWFENLGSLRFAYHRLTDMTGAYCARAGDVDLDGDLDVVAVAWLSSRFKPPNTPFASLPSILCLEQTSPGTFVRHTLERGLPHYPTLELADFDDDGDLDFALGLHVMTSRISNTPETPHRLSIWWNQVIADSNSVPLSQETDRHNRHNPSIE
ncbi:MAG TPA: VCBS repeat-containing protein [Pirellulaceae bacterium]|nr:VCBS repeat-containing protein [Pirellulaceae bacterium]